MSDLDQDRERVVSGLRERVAEAKCTECGHSAFWHGRDSGCDCYPDGGAARCGCPRHAPDVLLPLIAAERDKVRAEWDRREERLLSELATTRAERDGAARQARADGWDEGYTQGCVDCGPFQYDGTDNPHRAALPEARDESGSAS
jgi:hypothetical protein